MQRDAQVFFKMVVLVEDWARALPYTVFMQALQNALAAGTQLPGRTEEEKAPRYDLQAYDQLRIQQAEASSLRSRYATGSRSKQRTEGGGNGGPDYAALGSSPAQVCLHPPSTYALAWCYAATRFEWGHIHGTIEFI
jgi:hypothetical protein